MTKRWSGFIKATSYFEPDENALLDAIVFVLEQKFPSVVGDALPIIELENNPEDIRDADTERISGKVEWRNANFKRGELKVGAKIIDIPYYSWDKDGIEVTIGKKVFSLEGLERKDFKFVRLAPRFRRTYSMPVAFRHPTPRGGSTLEPKYNIGRMCRAEYDKSTMTCKVVIEGTKRQHDLLVTKPDVKVLKMKLEIGVGNHKSQGD